MKTLASALLLVVMTWTPELVAQAPAAKPQNAQLQQRLDEMKRRLDLSPEQVERLRPILRTEAEKMKALRDRTQGQSRRGKRQALRELRDIQSETDTQLRTVLSSQQMDELKKLREEWRRELRERRGQR